MGVLGCWWVRPPFWLILSLCALMLLDWGIQALGWKESSNLRRLVTGLLCGYALACETLVILKRIML